MSSYTSRDIYVPKSVPTLRYLYCFGASAQPCGRQPETHPVLTHSTSYHVHTKKYLGIPCVVPSPKPRFKVESAGEHGPLRQVEPAPDPMTAASCDLTGKARLHVKSSPALTPRLPSMLLRCQVFTDMTTSHLSTFLPGKFPDIDALRDDITAGLSTNSIESCHSPFSACPRALMNHEAPIVGRLPHRRFRICSTVAPATLGSRDESPTIHLSTIRAADAFHPISVLPDFSPSCLFLAKGSTQELGIACGFAKFGCFPQTTNYKPQGSPSLFGFTEQNITESTTATASWAKATLWQAHCSIDTRWLISSLR